MSLWTQNSVCRLGRQAYLGGYIGAPNLNKDEGDSDWISDIGENDKIASPQQSTRAMVPQYR